MEIYLSVCVSQSCAYADLCCVCILPFVCAWQLMSKMAPLLGKEMTERVFLDRFCEMCCDPLFHVRKVSVTSERLCGLQPVRGCGSKACHQCLIQCSSSFGKSRIIFTMSGLHFLILRWRCIPFQQRKKWHLAILTWGQTVVLVNLMVIAHSPESNWNLGLIVRWDISLFP